MKPANVIGVAGAGAWGMALANAAAAAGRAVILWGRDEDRMRAIATTRRSDRLPGVDLAPDVEATSDLEELGRVPAVAAEQRNLEPQLARLANPAGYVG